MENYEIEIIRHAFARCFGLKDALNKGIDRKDDLLTDSCLHSLSVQTGMRLDFIKDNVRIIKEL